jgi:Ca2+-transporting ATPase
MAEETVRWHAQGPSETIAELETNIELGLTDQQARVRLQRFGPNALAESSGPGPLVQFLRQFTDVTVIALLVAAVIATVLAFVENQDASLLERFGDAGAITAIVILNAVIGFLQERKAETALKALKDMTAPSACVLRDGEQRTVPAAELVPGDVLVLSEGDRVVADARIVEAHDLQVSEAALTGESLPVDKSTPALSPETPLADRRNMVFMGTHAAVGRGKAVITSTGMATELGRIAGLLEAVESPDTPLQKQLRRFGFYVVIGCTAVGLFVFAVGLIQLQESVGFLLLVAVSLAVAAIPEGLPAITTIVLALGVERMAKRRALVRRLAAVETLGAAHVICTDKTGTLTQNKMVVRQLLCGGQMYRLEGMVTAEIGSDQAGEQPPPSRLFQAQAQVYDGRGERVMDLPPALTELVFAAQFAPAASLTGEGERLRVLGDPTDAALLSLHVVLSGRRREVADVVRELPFDGERKSATVITRRNATLLGYTHGAPERLVSLLGSVLTADGSVRPLDDQGRTELAQRIDAWAAEGLRVLAVARHELPLPDQAVLEADRAELAANAERDLTLIALLAIADPPRDEVRSAMETARRAGVSTMMITGDHPLTARAIGKEVGLLADSGDIVTGADVERMSDDELAARVPGIRVVARATAETKLRLVRALNRAGKVVAMTGDGVNDGPAIKGADIGVAMGRSGTDVAREAADMVLADDNYATIVGAIEEGRVIYSNIRRFIVFLFAANAGLVLAVFVAAMVGWPPILTPTQILWINLITNGLPALALGMEPVHVDPMRTPPRDRNEPLLDKRALIWLGGYGAYMGIVSLGVFTWYWLRAGGALEGRALSVAQTMAFTVLAMAPIFHALNARSRQISAFELGVFSNTRLVAAFVVALVLQAIAIYAPITDQLFDTVPLSLGEALTALGLAATVWLVGEVHKLLRGRGRREHGPLSVRA